MLESATKTITTDDLHTRSSSGTQDMNWKTVLLVLGAIVLGLGVLVKIAIRTPVPPAHQVFINGNVLTMDANNTVAEAVAVRSDLIEAVGSSDDIMALT